jgi:hypothetical protein
MMSVPEPEVRLIVLEILQSLVDQRQYADKLRKIKLPKDISQLELPTETKANRLFDIAFMKKFGRQFLSQLYQSILMDNNTQNIFHAIYCLMNLVTLEAGDKDVLVDVIHFCFEIQSTIIKTSDSNGSIHQISPKKLSRTHYHIIHALIAAYFNLMSKLNGITPFSHHVDEIVRNRELHAPYLLPANAFNFNIDETIPLRIPKECLFSQESIVNALDASGHDTSRFDREFRPELEPDTPGRENYDDSETDGSIISETDTRTTFNNENQMEDISFQTIRDVFNSVETTRTRYDEKRRLIEEFRTKPFEELKFRVHEKQRLADQRIEQLLNVLYLSKDRLPMTTTNGNLTPTNGTSRSHSNTFNYPELFTY